MVNLRHLIPLIGGGGLRAATHASPRVTAGADMLWQQF